MFKNPGGPRPSIFCRRPCLGTCLFIKVPQPGNSEVGTFSVFESNRHLFLSDYLLIGRGNPVKCLAQRHNKWTCRLVFILSLYAERQAGKLWISTFKVFWFVSAREFRPSLPTFNTKI